MSDTNEKEHICAQCSAQLAENVNFCESCGAAVPHKDTQRSSTPEEPAVEKQGETPPPLPPTITKKRNSKRLVIGCAVIFIVILIILGCGAAWWFSTHDDKKSSRRRSRSRVESKTESHPERSDTTKRDSITEKATPDKTNPDPIAEKPKPEKKAPIVQQVVPTPEPAKEKALDDWIVSQDWFQKLRASLPNGVTPSINISSDSKPGWKSVEVREVHRLESGFDPDVSPLIGLFRVSSDRQTTEWMDPISGDWESLSSFLKSRSSSPPNTPVTPPVRPTRKLAANELAADINQDGRLEIVRWVPIPSTDENHYFQLLVMDDNDKTIWEGPKKKSTEHAFVFFETDFGCSIPQLLHDINGDGNIELIAPEPQSDVSPVYFKRLPWKKGEFFIIESRPLMMDALNSKSFKWKTGDHTFGIWVSRFGPVTSEGLVTADVILMNKDGNAEDGIALLRFNTNGATIKKWIKPLKSLAAQSGHHHTPISPNSLEDQTANDIQYAKVIKDYKNDKISDAAAFASLMKLAKRGHVDATYLIGNFYYMGTGVSKNVKQALHWLTLAAEKGNDKAMFNLGHIYGEGDGVPRDDIKAVSWFLPAAKAGNKSAANNMGYHYDHGLGVKKDKAMAQKWYRIGAKLGNPNSMCNLGNSYYRGDGVKQNLKLARQWLICSATRGSSTAANSLGLIYALGKGVPQEPTTACRWWAVAIRGGYTDSESQIKIMAKKMGWKNYNWRKLSPPQEMVEAKKGTLPPLPE